MTKHSPEADDDLYVACDGIHLNRGEILVAERGVESLFGRSKRVGWDYDLVTSTVGEPSRSP